MRIQPKKISDLKPAELDTLMKRSMEDVTALFDYIRKIVLDVRDKGDALLAEINREFKADTTPQELEVTRDEIREAHRQVAPEIVGALKTAAANITRFHQAQREREMWSIEVAEGIMAGRITRPLDRVGCYIPGGRAAYPSTILMTVIPARVAGVAEIIVTTPPGEGMRVNPVTLVAADLAGCHRIFKVGGPWGIAALAFGTERVPKADKIVGPGNKYVTAAKLLLFGQVGIDSPAGPSEALILADESPNPEWVALDFLSQLEHDPDSAAVLVTTSPELAQAVCEIIDRDMEHVPRKEIIEEALARNAHVLLAEEETDAVQFANAYAPEHLQILTREPFMTLSKIRHAGSIFLGPYAPVAAGDYASGTNHVLPTGQCARMFSGLSVDDFIKKPTFQYLTKTGLAGLKEAVTTLAAAEGLPLHGMAVEARFKA